LERNVAAGLMLRPVFMEIAKAGLAEIDAHHAKRVYSTHARI
jgi:hypothetical protein